MNGKLVSTITTVYQRHDGIYDTLDSIFSQDYPNIQIVISDDGSDNWDDAVIRIEEYINRHKGENIKSYKLLHLPYNQGTVKNVNNALKAADGDYIKPIGCGDKLADGSVLTNCVEEIGRSNSLVAVGVVSKISVLDGHLIKVFFPDKRIKQLNAFTPEALNRRLYNNCIIPAIGVVFDARIFQKYGYYDESYKYIEDHPFWLKITRLGEKIFFFSRPVALYYTGGVSNGGHPELQNALKNDYLNMISREIEPYNKCVFRVLDNWLRRDRVDFVYDLRSAASLHHKLLCCIRRPFAAVYYTVRELKER